MSTTTSTTQAPWTDADRGLLTEIYALQCTSRMNAIYYGDRLRQLQGESFFMETTTAVTASGSGVAALAFFNAGIGQLLWQALAVIAAIVAVIKPLRAPSKRIEVFTRQQQGYHANFFALKKLGFLIRQAGAVTDDHRKRYDTVYDRHVQLSTEDESTPDEVLRNRAQEAVKRECPPSSFWWPPQADLPAITDDRSPERRAADAASTPTVVAPRTPGASATAPAAPDPAITPPDPAGSAPPGTVKARKGLGLAAKPSA